MAKQEEDLSCRHFLFERDTCEDDADQAEETRGGAVEVLYTV